MWGRGRGWGRDGRREERGGGTITNLSAKCICNHTFIKLLNLGTCPRNLELYIVSSTKLRIKFPARPL